MRTRSIGIGTKLKRLASLWRSPAFRPRYDDEGLQAILAASRAFREAVAAGDGTTALRGTATKTSSCSSAVRYFSRRKTRFLIDARTVLARSPANEARLPTWLQAAASQVRDDAKLGLLLYGYRYAPLRPGFPWQGRQDTTQPDLLFAARPHRFAFVPRWALAACTNSLPVSALTSVLDDWMRFAELDALPFCSNLVVIQRLLAATWAFAFLEACASTEAADCQHSLLKIIGQDIAFLTPRLGKSFPNNHLLVDRFAAWFIALMFPELQRNPAKSREQAETEWLEELRRQTYADGGGIEHSTHYHGIACELAVAYLLLSRVNGGAVSAHDAAHIGRMLRQQAHLCGSDGTALSIGDSSDDPMFPLDPGTDGSAAALRELYRALFAESIPPVRSDHPGVERAFWLLGGRLAPPFEAIEESFFAEYPDSGLVVFADHFEGTRCLYRTGPAERTRVLSGHMHSDLMSVMLTLRETPMLIDAGTLTYRFRPDRTTHSGVNWREYFASARAHNGLVVANKDPLGPLIRNFRALATVPTVRRNAGGGDDQVAFHEATLPRQANLPGFTRGVIHLPGTGFLIYNIVDSEDPVVEPRLAFQLAAGCHVHDVDDTRLFVQHATETLSIAYSAGIGKPEVVCGREMPTNGWVSRFYGEKVPAPQLLFDVSADDRPSVFALYGRAIPGPFSIECRQPSAGSRAFRIRSDGTTDIVLLNVAKPDAVVSQWGVTFTGRLAWLRIPQGGVAVLRWLDGVSCEAPEYGMYREQAPVSAAPNE